MASTNPARGMRDFLPADVRKREYVIGVIKEVYESYGFEPLETPAVENLETLTGKYGEEGGQLIFKILKRGEKLLESFARVESLGILEADLDSNDISRTSKTSESIFSDLALRYDLTVPLARVVANNRNDLPKFFKRYQIQPVWRADRPARGRFREFYQCDVDVIGSESMVGEAEIILAASEILTRLGFEKFYVRINTRQLLTRILEKCLIPNEKQTAVLTAIDKLDKVGEDGVRKEIDKLELGDTSILLKYLVIRGQDSNSWMPPDGANLQEHNSHFLKVIEDFVEDIEATGQIRELLSLAEADVDLANHLLFDPNLVRGLSYYTGTIMEINVPDLAGSLGGGGRYDGLIGMFGKEQIPACGLSLGLERILVVMDERGMFPTEVADSTPADVMVTIWSEETIADSLKLAQELRAAGLRVTLYPEADKLGKQMKYADMIKVPFVCVLGESEIADDKVTVKNMRSGEQGLVARSDVSKTIK